MLIASDISRDFSEIPFSAEIFTAGAQKDKVTNFEE